MAISIRSNTFSFQPSLCLAQPLTHSLKEGKPAMVDHLLEVGFRPNGSKDLLLERGSEFAMSFDLQ